MREEMKEIDYLDIDLSGVTGATVLDRYPVWNHRGVVCCVRHDMAQ